MPAINKIINNLDIGNFPKENIKSFQKAEEFINSLDPFKNQWPQDNYLFRGVDNVEYHLISNFYRSKYLDFIFIDKLQEINSRVVKYIQTHVEINNNSDNFLKSIGNLEYIPEIVAKKAEDTKWTESMISVIYEFEIIKEFINISRKNGVSIPFDTLEIDELLKDDSITTYNKVLSQWPMAKIAPCLALAQHYGLKTRFLDWTKSPYIAAYFAAAKLYENKWNKPDIAGNFGKFMSVWILPVSEIKKSNAIFKKDNYEITFYEPPSYFNQNLQKQKGVLSFVRNTGGIETLPAKEKLETGFDQNPDINKYIEVHVLPIGESLRVLKLLNDFYDISGASLFQGIDGCVKSTLEKFGYRS